MAIERARDRTAPDRPPRARRWSAAEFDALVRQGFFGEDEHLELIEGEICEMAAQGHRHVAAVELVSIALRKVFDVGFSLRIQATIALGNARLEPDIAIVAGSPRDFLDRYPTDVKLIVEVADSSLEGDRTVKASIYAAGGVQDYWIVNLVDGVLEVYRDPARFGAPGSGWHYRQTLRLGAGDTVSPVARPDSTVAVSSLLP